MDAAGIFQRKGRFGDQCAACLYKGAQFLHHPWINMWLEWNEKRPYIFRFQRPLPNLPRVAVFRPDSGMKQCVIEIVQGAIISVVVTFRNGDFTAVA